VVRRERQLPLKGTVLVERGDAVGPTRRGPHRPAGNVQTVNLAARLAIDPARVAATLLARRSAAPGRGR
jgi:hypothetical protein